MKRNQVEGERVEIEEALADDEGDELDEGERVEDKGDGV